MESFAKKRDAPAFTQVCLFCPNQLWGQLWSFFKNVPASQWPWFSGWNLAVKSFPDPLPCKGLSERNHGTCLEIELQNSFGLRGLARGNICTEHSLLTGTKGIACTGEEELPTTWRRSTNVNRSSLKPVWAQLTLHQSLSCKAGGWSGVLRELSGKAASLACLFSISSRRLCCEVIKWEGIALPWECGQRLCFQFQGQLYC